MFGRILAAFALFGAPLIGIVAPALSFAAFRKRRRNASHASPSVLAIVVASVVWVALCAAIAWGFMQVGFGFTWGWAHAGRPPLLREELTFLAYIAGGLGFLSACAFGLHRLLIAKS